MLSDKELSNFAVAAWEIQGKRHYKDPNSKFPFSAMSEQLIMWLVQKIELKWSPEQVMQLEEWQCVCKSICNNLHNNISIDHHIEQINNLIADVLTLEPGIYHTRKRWKQHEARALT